METMEDNIEIVREALPQGELLAQLAEECSELAQAALKLRRAVTPVASPTPVEEHDARYDVEEEAADVMVCLKALGMLDDVLFLDEEGSLCKWMEAKANRWSRRLELSDRHLRGED